jgi:hypothetical protein
MTGGWLERCASTPNVMVWGACVELFWKTTVSPGLTWSVDGKYVEYWKFFPSGDFESTPTGKVCAPPTPSEPHADVTNNSEAMEATQSRLMGPTMPLTRRRRPVFVG